MDILMAINSVITVLRQCHVSGAEAKAFGTAIDVLVKCVHTIEQMRKASVENGEHRNEQSGTD